MSSLRTYADRTVAAVRTARRSIVRRVTLAAMAVRQAWRLSLQLRVVSITLLASGVLVGAFGILVAERITDQLMAGKVDESEARVIRGEEWATPQLNTSTQRNDPGLNARFDAVLAQLAEGGDAVVAIVPGDSGPDSARTYPDRAEVSRAISPQLRRALAVDWRRAHQNVTADLGNGSRTYLVYATPVPMSWGHVELYYFFPLDGEVKMARQMTMTVVVTGVALVILLAIIAALVTRLVVRPVRLAARTAQRLSAGLLDQRMAVRGEDDLALLAASFNQMAANLQRHIQRLEEMSRLQRRFTSDVSHELRTPLTTIRMAADMLFTERDAFAPAVSRSAELLQLELDRFENLLTDLLEISRFDAGFAVLDAEPVDLVGIVRRVADRLAPIAERAGTRIEVRLPAEPVIAEVDARRVERILRNLVGNAIEYAERAPVEVGVAVDAGAVAVTVRDRGVGLKPGEDKLVFNRFWRADPSRARQTGGTGLGLSISLEDARLHGGWLEAWGAPGQGALFRLTLPVRAGDRLVSSPLQLVPDDAVRALPPAPEPVPSGLRSVGSAATGATREGGTAEARRPARAEAGAGIADHHA